MSRGGKFKGCRHDFGQCVGIEVELVLPALLQLESHRILAGPEVEVGRVLAVLEDDDAGRLPHFLVQDPAEGEPAFAVEGEAEILVHLGRHLMRRILGVVGFQLHGHGSVWGRLNGLKEKRAARLRSRPCRDCTRMWCSLILDSRSSARARDICRSVRDDREKKTPMVSVGRCQ